MKSRRNVRIAVSASLGMLMLILDSKTAITGAAEGVQLCIRTVIPSLLPFFVLSILLTSALAGSTISLLRPLGRLCGIPLGAESLLAIGLLGGYPVGAQSVFHAYKEGFLCKQEARRLLGFCNNAGPAFLFGIAGKLFHSQRCVWALWGIHIVSALIVGATLPGKSKRNITVATANPLTLPAALSRSVKIMADVCGWIVLFRVILAIFNRWFLWLLPDMLCAAVHGALELVNGFHFLYTVPFEGARFVLGSAFLAFGGLCVAMQTVSVTKELGTGWYFPGKILQNIISIILALLMQTFLFPRGEQMTDATTVGIIIAVLIIMAVPFGTKLKKTVAFQRKVVYNR